MRSFQGNFKCSTIGPVKSQSGSFITDNLSKANEFNSYFTNICSTLANNNSSSARDLSTQPVNHIYRITPTLQSFTVNRELLSYCFKRYIKVGKACGPDKITGKELQMLDDVFIDNFLNIAKKSFDDCMFPSQWKTAQVHCIHKKGSTQDCGNYRPISLLNIPSKLLESIACFQLDSFLNQHNLITASQWGFRKSRSSELLLLSMTEKWRLALDERKSIGIIFIDFQKAFDCVSHQILPLKLQASGLCGDSFDWIVNYLNNRHQFVSINGTDSEKKRLTSGVPQGSLLGPRLFSIFTNDLPLSLDSKIEMFADDSTAYIIGNSIDSISIEIQNLLHQLLTWSKFNSMFIHPTKSEVMFISKIPFIGPIRPITIDNKTISCVSSSSCLGVKLDNKLNWSPHIKMVNSNFNAKISKLKQMKTFNRSTLESIYFKGILPSVTYCISLWGSSKLLADLEDSHIRAARLIHNISTSIPNHAVLSTAKWSSIHYMYKRRLACIAYQAFHNLAPDDINSLFTKHVTSYNLRDNLRLNLKCSKSKALHDSFTHRASIVWNCLPSQLKSKPSYSSFKASIKKFSKCIDQIHFGTNSTATNNISDEFMYY